SDGDSGLLQLPDLDGSVGGNEQQDPDHAAAGLRLPRQGVLQAEDLRPPRGKVRITRMSQKEGGGMALNLPKNTIFDFITGHSREAWRALTKVRRKEAGAGGNFMFARQAMNLLEAGALLCSTDPASTTIPCSGAMKDFSDALYAIDPLYFTRLPGP